MKCFLVFIQIASPLPLASWNSWSIYPAEAVLYSPDTKVRRTGELALRKAIPANTNMKAIQDSLEDISYLLRIPQRKPYGTMEGNVKKALKPKTEEVKKELTATSADSQAQKLLCRKLQNCRVALFGICLLGNWFWHGVWIVVDVMYAATNADSQAFSGC